MKKSKVSKSGVPYLHFGNGEPLVLIHGLGEIKEGWHNQFELEDQYELIIPDLRGHGEYDVEDGISIENFAKDVIGLLKELGIESAHICGLSMGGAVTQEIYRQAPEMCRSLMLVSTFHYFPKSLGKAFLKLRKAKAHALSVGEQKDIAAHTCLYSWDEDNIKKFYNFYQPNRIAFLKSLAACLTVNNLSLLPDIKVPTIIIGGQYDAVLPVWIQLWMHKLMPHSEFIIIRNVGHIAKLEASDRFNQILRNFLKKQTRKAA